MMNSYFFFIGFIKPFFMAVLQLFEESNAFLAPFSFVVS
jgi:hypothetical protein